MRTEDALSGRGGREHVEAIDIEAERRALAAETRDHERALRRSHPAPFDSKPEDDNGEPAPPSYFISAADWSPLERLNLARRDGSAQMLTSSEGVVNYVGDQDLAPEPPRLASLAGTILRGLDDELPAAHASAAPAEMYLRLTLTGFRTAWARLAVDCLDHGLRTADDGVAERATGLVLAGMALRLALDQASEGGDGLTNDEAQLVSGFLRRIKDDERFASDLRLLAGNLLVGSRAIWAQVEGEQYSTIERLAGLGPARRKPQRLVLGIGKSGVLTLNGDELHYFESYGSSGQRTKSLRRSNRPGSLLITLARRRPAITSKDRSTISRLKQALSNAGSPVEVRGQESALHLSRNVELDEDLRNALESD